MIFKTYDLDLSGQSGVPSQWGLTLPLVVALLGKQLDGLDGVQLVADRIRRGAFEVTAFTQEAVNRLSSFKLKVSKEGRDFEIPLKEKTSGKKAVWISINGTTWGKLAALPHSYFDDVLKECGVDTIKVETRRRYYRGFKVLNGQREALVVLGDKHIERQHYWTDDEGKDHGWWLTYRGQPYSCRKCEGKWHEDGNCPKWEKRDDANGGQQKLLVFSTSFLRHAKDTKDVRYDCVPGAQVGHIGNHIVNDATILPNADVVVVAAGQNMGGDTMEVTKEKMKAQGKVLVRALKPYSEDKKVYLVDPAIGEAKEGDEDEDEQRFLRAEMRRLATEAGGKFIPMDDLNLEEDDMDDEIHLSERGTRRFLMEVRDFIRADIGKDVFGDIATSSRDYAGQRLRHYKVGCPKCTFLHEGPTCPKQSAEDDEENDSGDGDGDNNDDDDATKPLEPQEEDDETDDNDNNSSTSSRSSRKKKRNAAKRLQQQQQQETSDASPSVTDTQAGLQAVVATPTHDLASSFAAAVASTPASTPARKLPAAPGARARSTSSKRGSDGEQSRSDSLKRQKMAETELETAINRNREHLIGTGMAAKQQMAMWKGLKGVQLLKKQTEMISKVNADPNMFRKGGRK